MGNKSNNIRILSAVFIGSLLFGTAAMINRADEKVSTSNLDTSSASGAPSNSTRFAAATTESGASSESTATQARTTLPTPVQGQQARLPEARLPEGLEQSRLVQQETIQGRSGIQRLSVFETSGALGRVLAIEKVRDDAVVNQSLFSADHLVVSAVDAQQLAETAAQIEARGFKATALPGSGFIYVNISGAQPQDILAHREAIADILEPGSTVELDAIGSAGAVPNDPGYSEQYFHESIESENAWDMTTGSQSITVAVLDTGLSMSLGEFSGRTVAGYDYANWDTNPTDDNGHGTAVAGTIAANANNGNSIAGVDWKCKIMPIKVLDSSNYGYYSWWTAGINFAVTNGARVINLSAGGSSTSSSLTTAIDNAIANGVIFVTVTHNDGTGSIRFPGSLPQAITVGAVTSSDVRSYYSNWGSAIDLVAPGSGIYCLDHYGNQLHRSGTSFAAPQVSGVAALLLSIDNGLTQSDVESLLVQGADDQVGDAYDTPGFDVYYGWGRLNAFKSLSLVQPETSANIVVDGSFFYDFGLETNSGRVYPGDSGWKVPASSAWNWMPDQRLAQADTSGAKALVQVIENNKSSTGANTLKFELNNTAGSGTELRVFVWGVNGTNFEVSNWNKKGPVNSSNTPIGQLLLVNPADGDLSGVTGFNHVEIPLDLGDGYDYITVLFWTVGPNSGVHEFDNVSISSDLRIGSNLLTNADFSSELKFNSGTSNQDDAGLGWIVPGSQRWSRPESGYIQADDSGARGIVQIVRDGFNTTGQREIVFDLYNSTDTIGLKLLVWGINGDFALNLWQENGLSSNNATSLLVNAADGDLTTIKGHNTVSVPLDLGNSGFEYIVVLFQTDNVPASEVRTLSNVYLGAAGDDSSGASGGTIDFADVATGTKVAELTTVDTAGTAWTFLATEDAGDYIKYMDLIDGAGIEGANNGDGIIFGRQDGEPFGISSMDVANMIWSAKSYTITGTRSNGSAVTFYTPVIEKRSSVTVDLEWDDLVSVRINSGSYRPGVDNIITR